MYLNSLLYSTKLKPKYTFIAFLFQVKKLKILHNRKYKFKAEIGKLEENTNTSSMSVDDKVKYIYNNKKVKKKK